jgi:hypothetical protein
MTNVQLSDLLLDSLALWGAIGRTVVGDDEVRITTDIGKDIAIRRQNTLARGWSVEILKWPVDAVPPGRRVRSCASVVSLLRTARALVSASREDTNSSLASERTSANESN